MRWYNPLSWFRKYETQEQPELLERERRRSELHEKIQETRILLEYAAVLRCLPVEMEKRRIHSRYRCFADLKQ